MLICSSKVGLHPPSSTRFIMIIRHDIDPNLYLIDPAQFPAVVSVDSAPEEVFVAYDPIDQLLKPSLAHVVEPEPVFRDRCDAMGTLIQPNWILTAAHVATELSLEKKISLANAPYSIQQIVLHPGFINYGEQADITLVKNDIALIQLTEPVENISPLPLYKQPNELGKIVTFVGQGDYGNGLIGPDSVDEKTRMATNRIEKVDDQWLIFKFDAPPEATELEGIAAPGDSGGPALIKTETGWALAGVSAGQDSNTLGEGYYGVWEYYTRVSAHLNWIESVLQS
jgi:Trypsin